MSSSALALAIEFDDEAPASRSEVTTTNLARTSRKSLSDPWTNQPYCYWPNEKAFNQPARFASTPQLSDLLSNYQIWLGDAPTASLDLGQQSWIQGFSSCDPTLASDLSVIGIRTSVDLGVTPERAIDLKGRLSLLLAEESLEDGVPHPAEGFLIEELQKDSKAFSAVANLVRDRHFKHRVELVLCLGRIPFSVLGIEILALISELLRSDLLAVRDAAARAVELWEEPAGIELLRAHKDPSPWLADYIRRVVASSL